MATTQTIIGLKQGVDEIVTLTHPSIFSDLSTTDAVEADLLDAPNGNVLARLTTALGHFEITGDKKIVLRLFGEETTGYKLPAAGSADYAHTGTTVTLPKQKLYLSPSITYAITPTPAGVNKRRDRKASGRFVVVLEMEVSLNRAR